MKLSPIRSLEWKAEVKAELKVLLEQRSRIEPRIRELENILRTQFGETWGGSSG